MSLLSSPIVLWSGFFPYDSLLALSSTSRATNQQLKYKHAWEAAFSNLGIVTQSHHKERAWRLVRTYCAHTKEALNDTRRPEGTLEEKWRIDEHIKQLPPEQLEHFLDRIASTLRMDDPKVTDKVRTALEWTAPKVHPMLDAALTSNVPLPVIRQLVEEKNSLGEESLYAALDGTCCINTLCYLIDQGAPIPENLLSYAISKGYNSNTIRCLIEKGVKPDALTLNYALKHRFSEVAIEYLLAHEAKPQRNSLTRAIQHNFSPSFIEKLIIWHHLRPDSHSLDTALETAYFPGPLLDRLLQMGATPSKKSLTLLLENGQNLFTIYQTPHARMFLEECAKTLLHMGCMPTPKDVVVAIKLKLSTPFIHALLCRGISPNEQMVTEAIRSNYPKEFIHELLKQGAVPSDETLSIAIAVGRPELIRSLLEEYGAVPGPQSLWKSILHAQEMRGLLETLVKFGATPSKESIYQLIRHHPDPPYYIVEKWLDVVTPMQPDLLTFALEKKLPKDLIIKLLLKGVKPDMYSIKTARDKGYDVNLLQTLTRYGAPTTLVPPPTFGNFSSPLEESKRLPRLFVPPFFSL